MWAEVTEMLRETAAYCGRGQLGPDTSRPRQAGGRVASEWPEPHSPHLPKRKPQPTVKCLEDPNCAFKYGGYTQINKSYGKLVHFTAEHYVCRWQGHGEFPLSSVCSSMFSKCL